MPARSFIRFSASSRCSTSFLIFSLLVLLGLPLPILINVSKPCPHLFTGASEGLRSTWPNHLGGLLSSYPQLGQHLLFPYITSFFNSRKKSQMCFSTSSICLYYMREISIYSSALPYVYFSPRGHLNFFP